jgi:hypothetical protein
MKLTMHQIHSRRKSMRITATAGLLAGIAMMWSASPASAGLTTFAEYSGDVGVSVNAGGSVLPTLPNGLTADIPVGSVVVNAFLYTSTFDITVPTGSIFPTGDAGGTFAGNAVSYTALTPNPSSALPLQAGVADVTAIVQGIVGPVAAGGVYNFGVTETNTAEQDGEVLVVVYSNTAITSTKTIGILDGAASSAGDSASITFAAPPSNAEPNYLSIGDGFSFDQDGVTSQFSTIDVDGGLLTAAAGNCDESQDGGTPPNATTCANGDLITAGTLGLNADGSLDTGYSNPITPIGETDTSIDHELYNISPLINPLAGDTITTMTSNTSLDDNVFLEVYDVNGQAVITSGTPEPSTIGFAMIGLLFGFVLFRKLQRT